MGAGAGAGAGVSGVDVAGEASFDALLGVSLSLEAGPGLFDFELCFEPPPIRLRKMFHLPLPESSSGESLESVDREGEGRRSASGIRGAGRGSFRWLVF